MKLFTTILFALATLTTTAAAQGDVTSHGQGCNGFHLISAGYWDVGGTSYLFTGPTAANAPVTIFLGAPQIQPLDLSAAGAPGCRLYAAPIATLATLELPASGQLTTPIEVPNEDGLIGLTFTLQAMTVNSTNDLGISTSNALTVTISERMGD